eukprot:Skav222667  [mRNA]  locus=scaffold997:522586:532089:+ [translate_table: standard]
MGRGGGFSCGAISRHGALTTLLVCALTRQSMSGTQRMFVQSIAFDLSDIAAALEFVGVELVIFLVTLIVAFVWRHVGTKRFQAEKLKIHEAFANELDEIALHARDTQSPRTVSQVMQMYEDLLERLAERSMALPEVTSHSRHTAVALYGSLVNRVVRGVARPLHFYESTMKQLAGQSQEFDSPGPSTGVTQTPLEAFLCPQVHDGAESTQHAAGTAKKCR